MKKRAKNSKKGKKDLTNIVILLLIVVAGMSIAYAAIMSTTLTVGVNKITQSSLSWNVGFQTGTVTATVGGSGDTGRSCGSATVTADTVTVADTTLSKPEDSCTYALVIKNTGGIDAKLGTISAVNPGSTSCTGSGASFTCGNITYTLATNAAGTTLLATNSTIAKTSGTLTVYLVLKYTGSEPASSASTQTNGGFTLVYNQA